MRKALIVGLDYYERIQSLAGAVNDAHSVKTALERNADGTRNFAQPNLMTSTGSDSDVTRAELREAIEQLFRDDAEIALLYFAGHGHIDDVGGYLLPATSQRSTMACRWRTSSVTRTVASEEQGNHP